ncbi:hypothetical protein B0H17DRAFT_1199384 [Mycena rosella]|uniref:Uncharacterized protein n=1 Tax=Mycena rosella TaxID=1033263 RepID=A0AAD7DLH6_MYCRO|nr:hypothetical protein B0H17DRAFT_1199384 [Mycena rosella]
MKLIPDSAHDAKAGCLRDLAVYFMRRHQRLNTPTDIEYALLYYVAAVNLMPDDHPEMEKVLEDIAGCIARYDEAGDLEDTKDTSVARRNDAPTVYDAQSRSTIFSVAARATACAGLSPCADEDAVHVPHCVQPQTQRESWSRAHGTFAASRSKYSAPRIRRYLYASWPHRRRMVPRALLNNTHQILGCASSKGLKSTINGLKSDQSPTIHHALAHFEIQQTCGLVATRPGCTPTAKRTDSA